MSVGERRVLGVPGVAENGAVEDADSRDGHQDGYDGNQGRVQAFEKQLQHARMAILKDL